MTDHEIVGSLLLLLIWRLQNLWLVITLWQLIFKTAENYCLDSRNIAQKVKDVSKIDINGKQYTTG